jgi:hypothetical protein
VRCLSCLQQSCRNCDLTILVVVCLQLKLANQILAEDKHQPMYKVGCEKQSTQ